MLTTSEVADAGNREVLVVLLHDIGLASFGEIRVHMAHILGLRSIILTPHPEVT